METQNKAQRAKKIQAIIRAEDSDFAEMLEYADYAGHDWRGRGHFRHCKKRVL